jgi:hypothetical protein
MKGFALFAAFFLVFSCSDSDKFSGESNQQIRIEGLLYESYESEIHLYGNCFSGNCSTSVNCFKIIDDKCCLYSKDLNACHISDYLWVIDNDTILSSESPFYDVGYGEHHVKLILVDAFGDSINYSESIKINEPLGVTLLSPVENYEASKNNKLVFQYRVRGIDTWEDTVYVSADKSVLANEDLLWEKGVALENKFLEPPLKEQVYCWGVKVSTQNTTFHSRIRRVWIKN